MQNATNGQLAPLGTQVYNQLQTFLSSEDAESLALAILAVTEPRRYSQLLTALGARPSWMVARRAQLLSIQMELDQRPLFRHWSDLEKKQLSMRLIGLAALIEVSLGDTGVSEIGLKPDELSSLTADGLVISL